MISVWYRCQSSIMSNFGRYWLVAIIPNGNDNRSFILVLVAFPFNFYSVRDSFLTCIFTSSHPAGFNQTNAGSTAFRDCRHPLPIHCIKSYSENAITTNLCNFLRKQCNLFYNRHFKLHKHLNLNTCLLKNLFHTT